MLHLEDIPYFQEDLLSQSAMTLRENPPAPQPHYSAFQKLVLDFCQDANSEGSHLILQLIYCCIETFILLGSIYCGFWEHFSNLHSFNIALE